MKGALLRPAAEVDPAALRAFLERCFGAQKARFLERHGTWWHGGRENRMALLVDGAVAAYCGVIPARCRVAGEALEAVWWNDLVVAPELRGRGLQRIFDRAVRQRCGLLLGFPNELAARIHRRHGWGVRDDLRAVMAPLRPPRLAAVTRSRGAAGSLLRAAAGALAPFAGRWRRRLAGYSPRRARRLAEPDLERWAELARRGAAETATTLRDETHLRHRYLEAPYRGELRFYECADLALVCRRLRRRGSVEERVLDLFGDLDDEEGVGDLLRCVLGEAVRAGAAQVTALAAHAELAARFRRRGFLLASTARFCWSSPDPAVMDALGRSRLHWCLGDSDNDEPV